jgi:O-antigen/teichoic acid export membrane protein
VRKTWEFGRPFVLISIFAWAATLADRWVVDKYKGLAEVGFYAVVAGIASKPITIAAGALGTLMRPILYSAASEQNPARLRRAFIAWLLAALLVGIGCFLFCWLGSSLIAWALLSENYRAGAAPLLFWASLGFILFPATQAVEIRLMSLRPHARLILPQAINAVCALTTAFIFVPRYGAVGAAQTRAIGGAVQFALTALGLLFLPPLQSAKPPVPASVPPIDASEATLETP